MTTRLKNSRSKPCSQVGAAAVELALVIALIMLPIVAGVVEFGRAFWYADALTKATRDGARLMSSWPVATVQSVGTGAAQVLVRQMSNAANVAPVLIDANVVVECLNAAFGVVACSDGSAPANVRVRITGFSIALGSWMPFVGPTAGLNSSIVYPSPHTTMRYMNGVTP
jgi:Flp pilus assembly protein TadG